MMICFIFSCKIYICEDGRGQTWCDGYTAKQRDRGSTVVWDIVIGVVEETED
jgi:hypothetical protein